MNIKSLRIAAHHLRPTLCALAVWAVLIAAACRQSADTGAGGGGRGAPAGQTGPRLVSLELEALTGNSQPIVLEELAGQVVLLNFWGTWCPPCQRELPHIAALEQKYRGRADFRLLAVSCAGNPSAEDSPQGIERLRQSTAEFLRQRGLDMPTYADPGQRARWAVNQAVGFEGYPTTLLIDRQGVIRKTWVGYTPGVEKEMQRAIEELLAEGQSQV